MTALDDKLVPKVLALITRLGKTVTFEVKTGGTYNPSTSRTTGETTSTKQVKVVPPYPFKNELIGTDNIKSTDMQTYLPASGLVGWTPKEFQVVTVDSLRYTVIRVSPIYTGEQIALYHLRLEKGV